jgi:Fe-S-cluster containining protein
MANKKQKKKDQQVRSAFKALDKLYGSMPDTVGCLEYINKPESEGGCAGRCCRHLNPHVFHVEFLHTWKHVLQNWTWDRIINLVERAIRNYLSTRPTKGCIFWDPDSKLCQQHLTRPWNCRVYSITPDEEMKPRIEKLKILYQNRVDAVIFDQCRLPKTVDGTEVTTEMTSKWWKQLVDIEKSLGVKDTDIKKNTTYMTYHDHLLLHVMPDYVMKQLGILKLHGEGFEKETAIKGIMDGFRKRLEKEGLIHVDPAPSAEAVDVQKTPSNS